MYFSFILASLVTSVCTSPLSSRASTCHPNFEGVGVSVVWDDFPFNTSEWAPGSVGVNVTTIDDYQAGAQFRFEQTGSTVPTYIGK